MTGTFSGNYFNETLPDTTDSSGTATPTSTEAVKKPVFTFCITDITHADLTYAPGDDLMTCPTYP